MSSETSVISSQPRTINDLPPEILLEIMSYFELEFRCIVIAKVCRRWNKLAKHLILWKKQEYTCGKTSDISRVKEVLTTAPALDSLIIRERQDAADILEFLLSIHVNLRELILDHCNLGMDSTGLLTNFVRIYPDLKGLTLDYCGPVTTDGYHLITRLEKISELNLSDCEGLSGKTVRLIADSCQHLKKFSLTGNEQIVDDDVIHIITKLGKGLTTLELDMAGLTDIAYSSLNNCARLQQLAILNCRQMTDRMLLEGIGPLQELTSLRIDFGNGLTAHGLSSLLHRPSMISIVSLDLSGCKNMDDEVMKEIAESCTHLKELAVDWCELITDAGINMVTRHCSQLRTLSLKGLITVTGNGWMARVPSRLPHLTRLFLEMCAALLPEYVQELMAAVPKLNISK